MRLATLGEDGTVTDREGHPVLQYVDGKFWVNNHAHILSGKNGFSTELLYLLLGMTNVAAFVTGAVQPKISQSNLNKVPVLIPSGDELVRMDEQIQPMFARLRDMKAKNRRLAAIRDDLLSKLMSGELDVSTVSIDIPTGTDGLVGTETNHNNKEKSRENNKSGQRSVPVQGYPAAGAEFRLVLFQTRSDADAGISAFHRRKICILFKINK